MLDDMDKVYRGIFVWMTIFSLVVGLIVVAALMADPELPSCIVHGYNSIH